MFPGFPKNIVSLRRAGLRKEKERRMWVFYAGITHYYEKVQLVPGVRWEMEST